MAVLPSPSAIRASTSRSRGLSRSSRVSGRVRVKQLRDDLRVDGRAAVRHPVQRVEELLDPADPLLEQVAEPGDAAGEQLGGEAPARRRRTARARPGRAGGAGPRPPRRSPRRCGSAASVRRRWRRPGLCASMASRTPSAVPAVATTSSASARSSSASPSRSSGSSSAITIRMAGPLHDSSGHPPHSPGEQRPHTGPRQHHRSAERPVTDSRSAPRPAAPKPVTHRTPDPPPQPTEPPRRARRRTASSTARHAPPPLTHHTRLQSHRTPARTRRPHPAVTPPRQIRLQCRRAAGWAGQVEGAVVRRDPAADAGEAGAAVLVGAAAAVVRDPQQEPCRRRRGP